MIISAISGVPTTNVDGFVTESVVVQHISSAVSNLDSDVRNNLSTIFATLDTFHTKANIDALFVSRSYFDQ